MDGCVELHVFTERLVNWVIPSCDRVCVQNGAEVIAFHYLSLQRGSVDPLRDCSTVVGRGQVVQDQANRREALNSVSTASEKGPGPSHTITPQRTTSDA